MARQRLPANRPETFLLLLLLGALGTVGTLELAASAQNRNRDAPQRDTFGRPAKRYGLSAAPPRTPGAIRIATYNTLNLFDEADDPALQGEFDDIKNITAKERCAQLAAAIRAIDADIVALQEIESLQALTWFRDTWLGDAGYQHLASMDVGYYRGVECSIMSRFKVKQAQVWKGESLDGVARDGLGWSPVPAGTRLSFQRSPLMVEVEGPGGYELTLFAIHHKAGREFSFHREAEAVRIMELVDSVRQRDPKRNIIVLGDFNASPFDKSFRVYLEGGMIDTLGHRVWQGDDPEMLMFKTHESNRVIDYILLNSAAHREFVIGSAFVYGTVSPPPGYDFNKDPHPPGYASDHYPVVVELMPREQP